MKSVPPKQAPHETRCEGRRRFLKYALVATAAPFALCPLSGTARAADLGDASGVGAATIDVRAKGAKGDGNQDDTAAFQAAIDSLSASGGTVTVSAGSYLINAVRSIKMRSRVRLQMAPGAKLCAMPNDRERSCVIAVWGVKDVEILGGSIVGERDSHRGTTGEWGHGISIRGSEAVTVQDIHIADCWGDGVYIGAKGPRGGGIPSTNIHLSRVTCDNNRRQGLSITPCRHVTVVDSTFRNTNGTKPQAGIDIEPQGQGMTAEDIRIERCILSGNRGDGLELHAHVTGLVILDCNITDNHDYGVLGVNPSQVTLERNTISGNGLNGVRMKYKTHDVKITRNKFANNGTRRLARTSLLSLVSVGSEHPSDLVLDPTTSNISVSGNVFAP